ncbi:MAG: ATP-grasp domain-containing protein [Candidatus Dojkabacteria bacterium]
MNPLTEKLIQQVNEKLKDSPLFFFSRDAERSLGLENVLDNYYIAAVESNYVSHSLKKLKENNIKTTQEHDEILKNDSTLELVKNAKVQEWIKQHAPNKFYAQFFHFNQPAVRVMEGLGGTVLNISADLNRKFEGKLSQYKVFEENSIPTPKSLVANISDVSWASLSTDLGSLKFVVQEDRAHTGIGTHFLENEGDFLLLQKALDGNIVRISQMVDGNSYTINGCVTKKGVFVAGLQYQITGIRDLTPGKGSTIGNDWTHGYRSVTPEMRIALFDITKKIGEIMQKDNYRGLYGIDLVVDGDKFFVIEINARQTANIPLQTKLELNQNQVPLALINLAEWLDIDFDIEAYTQLQEIEGSQIFLRSKTDGFTIKDQLKSGIYRLQSDNAAAKRIAEQGEWTMDQVIYIDEEQDKPLIWQKDGYSIDFIEAGGFVLLCQKKGQTRNKFDEVARMQFTYQIVYIEGVAPWILEAMKAIEDRIR